jgi:hypothetical protein
MSDRMSRPLPMITRLPPGFCLSSATAPGISPCRRVEFGHSRLVAELLEATYLQALFSASLLRAARGPA